MTRRSANLLRDTRRGTRTAVVLQVVAVALTAWLVGSVTALAYSVREPPAAITFMYSSALVRPSSSMSVSQESTSKSPEQAEQAQLVDPDGQSQGGQTRSVFDTVGSLKQARALGVSQERRH